MSNHRKVEWLLRVGVAGEFLGHGVLAINGKEDWINWIVQLASVDASTAGSLLTAIGILDVAVAAIVLVRPMSPVLLWAAFWGFFTALIRPMIGAPIWDFIERFANWAAPLALFYFYKAHGNKE